MKSIIPTLSLFWLLSCCQSDPVSTPELKPEDYFRINQVGYFEENM